MVVLSSLGTDIVTPTSSITSSYAHHIYGVPFNLLFVNQLTKILNCQWLFLHLYVFQDLHMKKVIGERHWSVACHIL